MTRARRPGCRDLNGVLLLDKPTGISSNRALQEVKRYFSACKAGHTGSLDPLASGLLPICLGEATKVSQFLLDADKRYEVSARLGETTTTFDAEGEVVAVRPVAVNLAQVTAALARLTGEIAQIPPMYSAIKQSGQPLYKLARSGQTVERAPRQVRIYSIELLELGQEQLKLAVFCSKGTYIRSLVYDLGEMLGCGAHVLTLKRLQSGQFLLKDAMSLTQLHETAVAENLTRLLPPDSVLSRLPAVNLVQTAASAVMCGQRVVIAETGLTGWVRLYAQTQQGNRFLGIGQAEADGTIVPKRLFITPESPAMPEKSVEVRGLGG